MELTHLAESMDINCQPLRANYGEWTDNLAKYFKAKVESKYYQSLRLVWIDKVSGSIVDLVA